MGVVAEFRAVLLPLRRAFLDSAILIYHLEDIAPYSSLTTEIFISLANGNLAGVLSTISVTELLTKPFQEGKADQISIFEAFIHSLPQTRLIAPDYAIAKEAAALRGKYGLRTPDAILFSTAKAQACDAFLTNDIRLKKLTAETPPVIVLSDFVSP